MPLPKPKAIPVVPDPAGPAPSGAGPATGTVTPPVTRMRTRATTTPASPTGAAPSGATLDDVVERLDDLATEIRADRAETLAAIASGFAGLREEVGTALTAKERRDERRKKQKEHDAEAAKAKAKKKQEFREKVKEAWQAFLRLILPNHPNKFFTSFGAVILGVVALLLVLVAAPRFNIGLGNALVALGLILAAIWLFRSGTSPASPGEPDDTTAADPDPAT